MDYINLNEFRHEDRQQLESLLSTLRAHPPPSTQPQPRVSRSSIPPITLASSQPVNQNIAPGQLPAQAQIPQYRSIQLQGADSSLAVRGSPPSLPLPQPPSTSNQQGQTINSGFLGFQQMRRQVNQQCLALSNLHPDPRRSSLLPSQALQPRVSRRPPRSLRGAAVQPPSLASERGINQVYQ